MDYMLQVNPEVADEKLLQGIWELKHPYLPLFVAVFESKRYYERVFGEKYTSSLYYVPLNETSLVYFMARRSNYDATEVNDSICRELEDRWMKLLLGVWEGYCYAKTPGMVSKLA